MKIAYNWLRQYVELPESPETVAAALPLLGFDVESIDYKGPPPLENVVVGKIESFEQHPNADRLSVCQVRTEPAGELHGIVCGAKNFRAGDCVMVALPGAVLPGDFKIKRSKLRGVESGGMLCSSRELGIGDDHEGIMILPGDSPLGMPINTYFGEAEAVLEVEVTPNRPDCLSHFGIARELAAHYRRELRFPDVSGPVDNTDLNLAAANALLERVRIDGNADCPFYSAIRVHGVKVGPSPDWLRKAIESIGLRPINNVVDVTNYVLHELGQPLHAFDAAKIRGGVLQARRAHPGEPVTTLDGKVRELKNSMNVIADSERALVIAGVMGSEAAEVDDSTSDIVLESAYFLPHAVRATSRALGLSTDSSYRFERGVDPGGVEFAALRALDLILEVAGGTPVGPMLKAGAARLTNTEIELDPDFIVRRMGFPVDHESIAGVLESLGLDVQKHTPEPGETLWRVNVPSFRTDLSRPIDLAEEFIRVYGTDKIPATPATAETSGAPDSGVYRFNEAAARLLTGRSFDEALNYSLRSEEEVKSWFGHANADTLRLANPLASDQSHLRPSLVPGLLDVLQLNQARHTGATRFFERGRTFREADGKVTEYAAVAFVERLPARPGLWKNREAADFFSARALIEELIVLAGVPRDRLPAFTRICENRPAWQVGHGAEFADPRKGVNGAVGLLNGTVLKRWDIQDPVLAGVIYIAPEILERNLSGGRLRHTGVNLFPASVRDLALIADQDTPAAEIRRALVDAASSAVKGFALEACECFDLYEGDNLPAGKKSLAFSLHFRAPDRTLRDEEVHPAFEAIQKTILEKTAFTIRSS